MHKKHVCMVHILCERPFAWCMCFSWQIDYGRMYLKKRMLDFKIASVLILLRSKWCPHNGKKNTSIRSIFFLLLFCVHSKISCSNPLGAMNAKWFFCCFAKNGYSCYLIFIFIVLPEKIGRWCCLLLIS